MSKNKSPKHSDPEDYLAQVDWQNQQSQRQPYTPLPWYMEPKRKFKRLTSFKSVSAKDISAPVKTLLTMIALYIGYFLYKNDIKILIGLLVLGIFLFFIIRDSSKKPKDSDID